LYFSFELLAGNFAQEKRMQAAVGLEKESRR
jgi:hypothetical protein